MSLTGSLPGRGDPKLRKRGSRKQPRATERQSRRSGTQARRAQHFLRREHVWPILVPAGLVVLLATAIRLVVSAQLLDIAFVRTPKLDPFEYLECDRKLSEPAGGGPAPPRHGPGYPYFLATLLTFFGDSLRAVYTVQAILGGISSLLVAALAWRLTGHRKTAVLAGCVYAAYGPAVLIDTTLFAEGLLIFLLLTTLIVVLYVSSELLAALLGGVLLGLAALTRPTALAFLPVVVLWLALRGHRPRSAYAAAIVAALSATVTISPVVYRNWHTSGTLAIQGNFGLNFYLGNSPTHSGTPWARFGAGWDRIAGEAARVGHIRPADQDRYYLKKAADEIVGQPFGFLRVLASKALWLVQAEEIRDSHSFWFFRERSTWLAWLLTFGVVFPFAVSGAISLRLVSGFGRADAHALVLGFLAAMSVTFVALVAGFRYRLPIAPVLSVYAAIGLVALWDAARERNNRVLVGLMSAAFAVFALSHIRTHQPSHEYAEEWAFVGSALNTEAKFTDAAQAYREALRIDPSNGYAWDGLGLVAMNLGRSDEARAAFEKACAIDPDDSRAYYHLGLAAKQDGGLDEAIGYFRHALEVVPDKQDVLEELAAALVRTKQFQEALPVLRKLKVLDSRDPKFHLALARVEALAGDLEVAAKEAAAASALAPSDSRAWITVISLQLIRRDLPSAQSSLDRLAMSAPASPQLELLSAILDRLSGREADARRRLIDLGRQVASFQPAVDYLVRDVTNETELLVADTFLRYGFAEPVW